MGIFASLGITTLRINVSSAVYYCYAECHYAECCNAECRYAIYVSWHLRYTYCYLTKDDKKFIISFAKISFLVAIH